MLQLALFAIGSVGVLALSRHSLCSPRTHGFYRFFAFEAILALVLLNIPSWFDDPLAPRQIISWLLLLTSLFLATHAFYLLRVVGKPRGSVENTTQLVRVGAYRYIRHPLYCSLLALAWGAYLKDLSFASSVLILAVTTALLVTAKTEETEMLGKFGGAYVAYMKTTRMFIPFLV